MERKLIQNIDEYRQWAWSEYLASGENGNVERALGLLPIHECYDYKRDEFGEIVVNENGNAIDIDEDGNVIPEDTAETVKVEDWVNEIQFPIMVNYTFGHGWDRVGDYEICIFDYVSKSEFDVTPDKLAHEPTQD